MQNPISLLRSELHGRLPKGLAGASVWLAAWFCLLFALRQLPGWWGTFFRILQVVVGIALVAVVPPTIWQLVRKRGLWRLRNPRGVP
jgi:phosphoserine phosphatase RsbU/P